MKVWVFVEGISDRLALDAGWAGWKTLLRSSGWGIQIIPLDDKSRFFRKIGPRVAEKLVADVNDCVPSAGLQTPQNRAQCPNSAPEEISKEARRARRRHAPGRQVSIRQRPICGV